jgi:hypothetical protein
MSTPEASPSREWLLWIRSWAGVVASYDSVLLIWSFPQPKEFLCGVIIGWLRIHKIWLKRGPCTQSGVIEVSVEGSTRTALVGGWNREGSEWPWGRIAEMFRELSEPHPTPV